MKHYSLTIIAVLLFATNANAAFTLCRATDTTGGGANALDSYDGASFVGDDWCFVMDGTTYIPYNLDASSGATEEDPNIIAPDTNPGTKRWIRQYSGDEYENRIINSEMMIDQRNEGNQVSTSGSYIADRWFTQTANLDEFVFAADRTVSSQMSGYRALLNYDVSTAETAIAVDEYVVPFMYEFLGYDVADLVDGADVNISFSFYATQTGTYSVSLSAGDLGYSYVYDFSYPTTTTQQLVSFSVTIPAHATNYVSNTETGIGMILRIAGYSGSNYKTSSTETWAAADDICSSAATNWTSSTNTIRVTGVQFRIGTQYVPLEKKSRSEYLAECQDYYRKSFDQGVAPAQNTGDDNGALTYIAQATNTADGVQVTFDRPMVGVPTIAYYSVSAASTAWYNVTDAGASGASSTLSTGVGGFFARNASVATDAAGEQIYIHWTANSEI